MVKKFLILLLAIVIIGSSAFLFVNNKKSDEQKNGSSSSNQNKKDGNQSGFDRAKYSTTDPTSIWVIVNKKRPISADYVPFDLVTPNVQRDFKDSNDEQQIRQEVAKQVENMFDDAKKQGLNLMFASGYRSAKLQATYYNNYVARDGEEAANKYSAKPGTSEHQTGLAFDISRADRKCYLEICFGDTAEGEWLAENAYKYGFVLRYQKGKESFTSYQYEPWHFRYVGQELSQYLYKSNQTLEEFFSL